MDKDLLAVPSRYSGITPTAQHRGIRVDHEQQDSDSRETISATWAAQGKGLQQTWLCRASLPATSNSSFHCRQCCGLTSPPHQNLPSAFDSVNTAIPNPGWPLPQTWVAPGIAVPHSSPILAFHFSPAALANAISPPTPLPLLLSGATWNSCLGLQGMGA